VPPQFVVDQQEVVVVIGAADARTDDSRGVGGDLHPLPPTLVDLNGGRVSSAG
jgi:hypothetical protein